MPPVPDEIRRRPLLFVDDLDAPALSDADHHHFARVRRLAVGDPVTIGDGSGRWRPATFDRFPRPTGPVGHAAKPGWAISVAVAPVKGDRIETVVQRLTELGVDEIVVVVTDRTIVRWDGDRAAKAVERMTGAAREACLQSRRLRLPTIGPPTGLAELLRSHPEAVLADPGGRPAEPMTRTVVIGPEGGFSPEELAAAPTMGLPGHVLRSGTAAVAAATLLCASRDGSLC